MARCLGGVDANGANVEVATEYNCCAFIGLTSLVDFEMRADHSMTNVAANEIGRRTNQASPSTGVR